MQFRLQSVVSVTSAVRAARRTGALWVLRLCLPSPRRDESKFWGWLFVSIYKDFDIKKRYSEQERDYIL